jgi:hypothetical protein
MACSRIFDDDARQIKRNMIDTVGARYIHDTPGPGIHLPYIADPHIRIQGSGANNFCENMMDLNSDLRGMTRPYTRDIPTLNDYKKYAVAPQKMIRDPDVVDYITDETRASNPAWQLKENEVNRWLCPLLNPVDPAFLQKPFYTDLNTRMLEKDHYKQTYSRSQFVGSDVKPANQLW